MASSGLKAEVPLSEENLEVCCVCSKQGAKTCSKCKSQFYCGQQCQKSDWKIHKDICKQVVTTKKLIPDQYPYFLLDIMERMLFFDGNEYKIPLFHREYQKAYPLYKNNYQELCRHWMDLAQIMATEIDLAPTSNKDLLRRWRCYDARFIYFVHGKAKLGNIFKESPNVTYGQDYDYKIYQSMRNTPCQKMDFIQGQTYISIGFVDMFQLLIGTFKPTEDTSCQKPAIFIGYDMSEIVVARNQVLYQMMSDGMDSESILQVWFSTGWSEKTLEDFQSSCVKLLKQVVANEKVKKLVSHWMQFKISATAVLPLWTMFLSQSMVYPLTNLEHEVDRVDYARYLFTGNLFGTTKDSYQYGNSTLFCLPKGHQREDENFFYTLSLKHFLYKKSLMTSVTKMVSTGLNSLIKIIRNGKIICKFFVKNLTPSDKDTLREIRNINAKVIDWSNIPDYLSNDDFFSMSEACNETDTEHHLHYMNWVRYVFGASLFDYPNKVKMYKMLKTESENEYQHMKKNRLFLSQDKYHEINAADSRLTIQYRKYFLTYVFNGRNVAVSEATSEEFNPFVRSHACFNLSFKFLKK